jgi:hypothetical protein
VINSETLDLVIENATEMEGKPNYAVCITLTVANIVTMWKIEVMYNKFL